MKCLKAASLLAIATVRTTALAHYELHMDYSGNKFVQAFDFFTGQDPTQGHVDYKGLSTANATNLIGFLTSSNGSNAFDPTLPPPVYLGVDFFNSYPKETGRPSVRITSSQSYNHSLIIADIRHMPGSICGVWPAFWMLGSSAPWPNAGEIDIIEGVNDNDFNTMTLHTNAGITTVNDTSLFDGTLMTANCDVNAPDQDKNAGCSIIDKAETGSYGTKFNDNGGGVFAIEYASEHIAIWFFSRNAIPVDITANAPMPPTSQKGSSTWGKPNAFFRLPTFSNMADMSSSPASSASDNSISATSASPASVLATSPSFAIPASSSQAQRRDMPPVGQSADSTNASMTAPSASAGSSPSSTTAQNTVLPIDSSTDDTSTLTITLNSSTQTDTLLSTSTATLASTDAATTPASSIAPIAIDNTTPSTLDQHFNSLKLVIDTTFCGDWAGQVWSTTPSCSKLAPTCEEYVSSNPTAFKEAYWSVQSIKVYVKDDAAAAGNLTRRYLHSIASWKHKRSVHG